MGYSIIKDDILQQSMSKSLEVYHFMNDLQHLKTFPVVCQKNRPQRSESFKVYLAKKLCLFSEKGIYLSLRGWKY